MTKALIFIDGSWLYANMPRLARLYGRDYLIDYGKLPGILASQVAEQSGKDDVDVARTYYFGSYPSNLDPRDEESLSRRLGFFEMLKQEFHFEVETFPVDYREHRMRREDRDPNDPFEPKEKCVDICLATSMLSLAAMPYAYDVAIAVLGDKDFLPVLQGVRRLGKQVAIASIKGSCAHAYSDYRNQAKVRDYEMIWLDDLLGALDLKCGRKQRICESQHHSGDRKIWTDYRGKQFYCDECRNLLFVQKGEIQHALEKTPSNDLRERETRSTRATKAGEITRLFGDRQYGFMRTTEGEDYFFHAADGLGWKFEELKPGDTLLFEVKRAPSQGKAGAAQKVYLKAA